MTFDQYPEGELGISQGQRGRALCVYEATSSHSPPLCFILQEECISVFLPVAIMLWCPALSVHVPGMLSQPLPLSASRSSFKAFLRCHHLEDLS